MRSESNCCWIKNFFLILRVTCADRLADWNWEKKKKQRVTVNKFWELCIHDSSGWIEIIHIHTHIAANMALLLRKDVQKASYYVWFLGAEESRALRGSRILMSAIPYIVDRSQEIDPIKVTLQVSHKGMKIVQVNWLVSTFILVIYLCFFLLPAANIVS